jgi:hypothetical protein
MFITFLHDPFADYVLSQLNQVHFNVTLPNAAGRTSASESGGLEFKRRTLSRLLWQVYRSCTKHTECVRLDRHALLSQTSVYYSLEQKEHL